MAIKNYLISALVVLFAFVLGTDSYIYVKEPVDEEQRLVSQLLYMQRDDLLNLPSVTARLHLVVFKDECKFEEELTEESVLLIDESNILSVCDNFIRSINEIQFRHNVSAIIWGVEKLVASSGYGARYQDEVDAVHKLVVYVASPQFKILKDLASKNESLVVTVGTELGPFYDFIHSPVYTGYLISIPILMMGQCLFTIFALARKSFIEKKVKPNLIFQASVLAAMYNIGLAIRVIGAESYSIYVTKARSQLQLAFWSAVLWISVVIGTMGFSFTVLVWIRIVRILKKSEAAKLTKRIFIIYFYSLPFLALLFIILRTYVSNVFFVLILALIALSGGLVAVGTLTFGTKMLYSMYKINKDIIKKRDAVNKRMTTFVIITSVLWILVVVSTIGYTLGEARAYTNPVLVFPFLVVRDIIGWSLSFVITIIYVTSSSVKSTSNTKDFTNTKDKEKDMNVELERSPSFAIN